jgi:hypothetical protein
MQTFNQIKLQDSVGKTVKAVEAKYLKLLIVFTDNSFSFFERYDEFGSQEQSNIIITYQGFIDSLYVNHDGRIITTSTQQMFIDTGLLDFDKLIEDCKEQIQKKLSWYEAREREEYAKLKAKFEK